MATSTLSANSSENEIRYAIPDGRLGFQTLLQNNPGVIIIKLGAEWCGPCKKIEHPVTEWMKRMPRETIQCIILDIDESFEIYATLKQKKMVNGIPAILAYYQGNVSVIPDDIVVGADLPQIKLFFDRCISRVLEV
jgi:thiol-disulfide isomerase/thioredoxin